MNAPRYFPDRTFPATPFLPGQLGDGDEPQLSEDRWAGEAEALRELPNYLWGIDLYNAGYYWEAHEAWEKLWQRAVAASAPHRLLQGLIQCAASALKVRMKQWSACRKLADRGFARLRLVAVSTDANHFGIDLVQFMEQFESYVTTVVSASAGEVLPPQLLLHSTH